MDTIRGFLHIILLLFLVISGCSKEHPDEPLLNKTPHTYLWLFPDTSISEGISRQHIRWWGEDPDGLIKGYLFTFGKFLTTDGHIAAADTLRWTWTAKNDTVLAFPLVTKRDTFQIGVKGVDNQFTTNLPEHAIVRFNPSAYWDQNDNGIFDSLDLPLPSLPASLDPLGATLPMPLLNQPPSLVFARNPNDPSNVMQQPETTFTAATFSWIGSDPDGDETIINYEIALNDTADSTRWISVKGNVQLISLVVPRVRSDTAGAEVDVDVMTGTYATGRFTIGRISHLRLNALNTFYIRARDIAGDASKIVQMPSKGGHWYVKKPVSRLLIISDYLNTDSSTALTFYRSTFAKISGFDYGEVLNIARGLTAQQKKDSKIGVLVPPFIDPALVNTLHLFDIVFWFTDQIPSLAVAQYPLFQYVRDPIHHGKVIFTTAFESSSDPRGAIKDFAPIDSVSSVDLSTSRLLPTLGDTRVPGGYVLVPDSSDQSNIYPPLRFDPVRVNYSVYLRPIYRRADAKYIYHVQNDTRIPARYVYSPAITELKSVTSAGPDVWSCGFAGVILHSGNRGAFWSLQESGIPNTLNGIRFFDPLHGAAVGNDGSIVFSQDAGTTWENRSVLTFEDLYALDFAADTSAIVVGSNGLLIRSTNGGHNWKSPAGVTSKNLRAVHFYDVSNGLAVGDSGTVLLTTNSGISWSLRPGITARNLYAVRLATASLAYAVGENGTVIKSSNGGNTWIAQSPITGSNLHGLTFLDGLTGYVSGANGFLYETQDGGNTWLQLASGIVQTNGNGQSLNSITFSNASEGYAVATGGVIIASSDGGASWFPQPGGNLDVGVIDGVGSDGKRSFAFIALPLHFLNGDGTNVQQFLEKILLTEFGF